jgi:hypothetical protein
MVAEKNGLKHLAKQYAWPIFLRKKNLNAEASTCDLWIGYNQLTTKVHILYISINWYIKRGSKQTYRNG